LTTSVVEDYFNLAPGTSSGAMLDIAEFTIALDSADAMLLDDATQLQTDHDTYASFAADTKQQELQMLDIANIDYGQGEMSCSNDIYEINQNVPSLMPGNWISDSVPPEILDELCVESIFYLLMVFIC
jgi:hypothetical protein